VSEHEPLERFRTELAFAVGLEDTFTGGPVRGPTTVRATNLDTHSGEASFVETPSGYHALIDAPADPSTVELVVDADRYVRATKSVDRSTLDPDAPLTTIELVPGPGYPFGGGVTLVRGVVTRGGDPVPGATVAFAEGSDTTETDAAGEYALPIIDIGRDDVVTNDEGIRLLKPDGDDPTVEATHPVDGDTTSTSLQLSIGGTANAFLTV
jgi:hypothetical protein